MVALAPNNVWAAGQHLLHWNNTEWKIEDVSTSIRKYPGASDLSALAANDIWVADGDSLLHWNGKQWNTSYSSKGKETFFPGAPLLFHKILAVSPNDVWALGSINIATNCGGLYGYTFHWDGISWHKQSGPRQEYFFGCGGGGGYIDDIYATASHEIWGISGRSLVQWDGTGWRYFSCPYEGSEVTQYSPDLYSNFTDIAEVSKGELWITGSRGIPDDLVTRSTKRWHRSGFVLQPYLGPCPTPTPAPTERPIVPALPPQPNQTYVPGEVPTMAVPRAIGTSRVPDAVTTYPAPTVPSP